MISPAIPTEDYVTKTQSAILVLGMHRSGTSAMTRQLILAGAAVPRTLMPATDANAAGYWESDALRLHNDSLLGKFGSTWDDWRRLEVDAQQGRSCPDVVAETAQLLRSEFGEAPLIVIKDPRICRLAPIYIEAIAALGHDLRIVVPYRNPLEVAASLGVRDGVPATRAALIWLRYVLDAEVASRHVPRAFVSYDRLLGDTAESLDRLSRQLGFGDFSAWVGRQSDMASELEESHRHHRYEAADLCADPNFCGWIKDVFCALNDLQAKPQSKQSMRALDAIGAAFNAAVPLIERLQEGSESLVQDEPQSTKSVSKWRRSNQELLLQHVHRTDNRSRRETGASGAGREGPTDFGRWLRSLDWGLLHSAIARLRRPLVQRRLIRDAGRIDVSGLFDRTWYLETYSDVAESSVDPVLHYLKWGAAEGRDPSPNFDTIMYLAQRPYLVASGSNPLVHFLENRC